MRWVTTATARKAIRLSVRGARDRPPDAPEERGRKATTKGVTSNLITPSSASLPGVVSFHPLTIELGECL